MKMRPFKLVEVLNNSVFDFPVIQAGVRRNIPPYTITEAFTHVCHKQKVQSYSIHFVLELY